MHRGVKSGNTSGGRASGIQTLGGRTSSFTVRQPAAKNGDYHVRPAMRKGWGASTSAAVASAISPAFVRSNSATSAWRRVMVGRCVHPRIPSKHPVAFDALITVKNNSDPDVGSGVELDIFMTDTDRGEEAGGMGVEHLRRGF